MKFDIPAGKLNKVESKKFKRPINIGESSTDADIAGKANQACEFRYEKKNSIFEKTGRYIARVLRVEKTPNVVDSEGFLNFMSPSEAPTKKGSSAIGKFKFVRIKAYIPKIHKGCFPTPRDGNTDDPNYPDHYIIDMYPTFTARNDDLIMDNVYPGADVIVDYTEKDELTGEPIFETPIITYEAQIRSRLARNIAGQFNRPGCPPASVGTTGQSLTHSSQIKNHQGLSSIRARARQSNMKAFVFGDSQAYAMGPGMSKFLENVVGLNMIRARGAVGPWGIRSKRKVLGKDGISLAVMTGLRSKSEGYWPVLKRFLKQVGDGVVCIVGGRNGGPSEDQLSSALKKIISAAPNAKIIWVTPPGKVPAFRKLKYIVKKPVYPNPTSGPPYKPISLEQRTSHVRLRKRVASAAAQFPNKVLHVDAYSIMPDYVANGSKNKKGDGLHLTYSDLPELLNGLKAMVGAKTTAPARHISGKSVQQKTATPNTGTASNDDSSKAGPRITSAPASNCQPMGSMGQYGSGPKPPNTSGLIPGGRRANSFPNSLSQIDLNKVMPGLADKWKGKKTRDGFKTCFNTGMSPTKHVQYYKWTVLAMAAAEVIERYWRTWDSSAKVNISSHWRGFSGGKNKNHHGPAIDHEIEYRNGAIPSMYQWCSIRYLMGQGRLPMGAVGLYINLNGAKERNRLHPVGVTGPGHTEQGRNTSRSLKAPGGSTNVHYDYRGFADFKMGRGSGVGTPGGLVAHYWWRGSTSGSGKDDLAKTAQTKRFLTSVHPKGKQIMTLLDSWKTGNFGNNPPGFSFPQISEFVPNWSQVLGIEPWLQSPKLTS